MKEKVIAVLVVLFLAMASVSVAGERATPQEVFDKVLAAAGVLESLGEEGLSAFNDPKGEFVWKDSYVYVMDCEKGVILAHPSPKARGLSADTIKCKKTGRLVLKEACGMMNPKGFWLEYWWPMPGTDVPVRKIAFVIPAGNTPYQVAAALTGNDTKLEDLNKLIAK